MAREIIVMDIKSQSILLIVGLACLCGCNDDSSRQAAELASEAAVLMNQGRFDEARLLLEKASDLGSSCAEYHVGIAMASTQLDDYVTARIRYERALSILKRQSQNDPQRVDDYVMVLVCLNRESEARRVVKEAQGRFENDPTIQILAQDVDNMVEYYKKYSIQE